MPSPGKTVGDPTLMSHAEDPKLYLEQLIRMVKNLHIAYNPLKPTKEDPIMAILYSTDLGPIRGLEDY